MKIDRETAMMNRDTMQRSFFQLKHDLLGKMFYDAKRGTNVKIVLVEHNMDILFQRQRALAPPRIPVRCDIAWAVRKLFSSIVFDLFIYF